MKRFAQLFAEIDEAITSADKITALARYFQEAPYFREAPHLQKSQSKDQLWALALALGHRPKRLVSLDTLEEWASEATGLPPWLFEACQPVVGDAAETIALTLPTVRALDNRGLSDWIAELQALHVQDQSAHKSWVLAAWSALPAPERFILIKLITASFRLDVSTAQVIHALAQYTGIGVSELAYRLSQTWTPDRVSWGSLIATPDPSAIDALPSSFPTTRDFDGSEEIDPEDWLAEHKWDGIHAQLICRSGNHYLWNSPDRLITHNFPELAVLKDYLPNGTCLSGEILAFEAGLPLPNSVLEKRLGRKSISKKLQSEAAGVLYVNDLLEHEGRDIRDMPLSKRRAVLADLLDSLPPGLPIKIMPEVIFSDREALDQVRRASRASGVQGVVLRPRNSGHGSDQAWLLWPDEPLTIKAVLLYAQAGARSDTSSELTLAVRDGANFVPFAKTTSGLSDEEYQSLSGWVRKNTTQRFGPVRQVEPALVFTVAFDAIVASPRHKSGVTLRAPRIANWLTGASVDEAATLADLAALLTEFG